MEELLDVYVPSILGRHLSAKHQIKELLEIYVPTTILDENPGTKHRTSHILVLVLEEEAFKNTWVRKSKEKL